jgi:cathepsin L
MHYLSFKGYSSVFFLQTNGKKYEDTETELHRYNVWKSNHAMIDDHNKEADKFGFELEVNPYTDLTSEEFVAMYNGFKMAPTNSTRNTFKSTPSFKAAENVDWREKGAVTPVKNQGQCGSCWSFSATGSLEGQHFLKDGQLVSLSEQNLMDCSTAEGNHGCKGGLMDKAFEYIIKNRGIDTEQSYPYQAHDERCRFRTANVGATMSSFRDIEHGDVNALMEAIQTIGPISVAMDASRPAFHAYKRGVYSDRTCSSKKLDHGVLAVGFGTYEGTPYFLVKNSWGPMWGMEGYFMIERSEENMCGLATQASYPIV